MMRSEQQGSFQKADVCLEGTTSSYLLSLWYRLGIQSQGKWLFSCLAGIRSLARSGTFHVQVEAAFGKGAYSSLQQAWSCQCP
jgi:hypothetical protein